MIKGKGKLTKVAGHTFTNEFKSACDKLPDGGDYLFVICDNKKNRNLPYLSYLFSVVLKYISDALPDHPGTTALYRYFEAMFAPVHRVEIDGERYEYRDLKSENRIDVDNTIEKIVEYALEKWGIEIPKQSDLNSPENREFYSQAYLNQEVDWSNVISSHKKLSKDERRNTEES